MANNASALKRIRQIKSRTSRNRVVKSRLKAKRKIFLAAVEAGNAGDAQTAASALFSAADRAAKNNVIHKNSAANIKAKAAARLKSLS